MSVSSRSPSVTGREPGAARRGHHPGIALTVILACQMLMVLDGTIVNIALPDIQHSLGFSDAARSWVVNAYLLAFGGLLLLGGRAGDILGRRRVLVGGVILFTCASLVGGLAGTGWLLLSARALQGVGAALAAPGTLALIMSNVTDESARHRALGMFSAVAGSGMAVGLILGGALTSGASWRWVMFVNVPLGAAVAVLAPLFVNEPPRQSGRFDAAGALTSTLGMTALVFAFVRIAEDGWSDGIGLAAFGAALVLLAVFLFIEARAKQPIMPLRLFRHRNRAFAYLNVMILGAGLMSQFFFLTQLLQNVLGYSALEAGLAFLPMAVTQFVAARSTPKLIARFGAKALMLSGILLVVAGMAWLTQISDQVGYVSGVLPPLVLFGIGVGLCFMPLNTTIMTSAEARDAGSASGLLQALLQVGGSVGIAILTSIYSTAVRREADRPHSGRDAAEQAHHLLVHGISTAYIGGLVFSVIVFLVFLFGIRTASRPATDGS